MTIETTYCTVLKVKKNTLDFSRLWSISETKDEALMNLYCFNLLIGGLCFDLRLKCFCAILSFIPPFREVLCKGELADIQQYGIPLIFICYGELDSSHCHISVLRNSATTWPVV